MAFTETDWDAFVPLTIGSAQVAATMPDGGESGFPCVLVIDQANSVNYEGDAANIFTTVSSYVNDIAIVQTDGSTQLKHDVVEWSAAAGSRLLVCHILIPSLASASDTTVRLYYRDDGAADQQQTVYLASDDWAGYWPLQEEQAGTGNSALYKDLTDNNNDGDDEVSATGQTGQIGDGQEFDGSDYVNLGHDASLNFGINDIFDFSIGCWVYIPELLPAGSWQRIIDKQQRYGIGIYQDDFRIMGEGAGAGVYQIPSTGWHHIVVVYTNNNLGSLYVDGAWASEYETSIWLDHGDWDLTLAVTSLVAQGHYFTGNIDEAFAIGAPCSAAWITTTYNCQDDNGAFWTVGSETSIITTKSILHAYPGPRKYIATPGPRKYRAYPGQRKYIGEPG